MKKLFLAALTIPATLTAQSFHSATNELGLNLFNELRKDGSNLCISPYSIQSALTMTLNGAKEDTYKEMISTLGYKDSSLDSINQSYFEYKTSLTSRLAKKLPEYVGGDMTTFTVANRIFGQSGYDFEEPFLKTCEEKFLAPLKALDFKAAPDPSRLHINQWVEDKTNEKIKNLLPQGSITPLTRMVLTNCIYFNAGWNSKFHKSLTKDRSFTVSNGSVKEVPTMYKKSTFGYRKGENFEAVSIPYGFYQNFQFLVILPNKGETVSNVTKNLKANDLIDMKSLPLKRLELTLPKFKIEGASISLSEPLQKLGMKTAFDSNRANFKNISSMGDLSVSDVFHKTFIKLDEEGTEAAAATAVIIQTKSAAIHQPFEYLKVEINRPFFYAIQDRKTGNCFFMGEVQDFK